MSDEIDYQDQERLRYRMETSKEKSILIRNWIYTAISLIVAVMLVWALWSWKAANNMAGATSAKLNGILDKLDSKVEALDTKNVNELLIEIKERVHDLQPVERELAGAVSDLRYQTGILSQSLTARLRTIDELLLSAKGVADEGTRQLKQNGDALASVTLHADKLLSDNTPHINGAVAALERGMSGLATIVETSDPKVAAFFENADKLVIDVDGRVRDLEPLQTNLNSFSGSLAGMAADSQKKLHEILWPAPVKGFWPNVKRTASFLLTPILDGTRIYFSLKSLPVRVTQPIPLAK